MRWVTLSAISRRTSINRVVDTTIVNTTVILMYILLQCGTESAYMSEEALVTLHAQTLPCMELSTIVHGTSMSMSELQYSITGVHYKHAVSVWYGPDEIRSLGAH